MDLHLLSSHAVSAPQICYKEFVVNVMKQAFRCQTEGFILKSSRRPPVSNSRIDDSGLRNVTIRNALRGIRMPNPMNPLIVQSDKSVLLEVDNPKYEEARDSLARFAELVKSPEYVHTYRVTPLSLWNSAAMGMNSREIVDSLEKYAKYPIPDNIKREIIEYMSRYGQITLFMEGPDLILECEEEDLAEEIGAQTKLQEYLEERIDERSFLVVARQKGFLKHALLELGHPVEDLAGYVRVILSL